MLNDRFTASKSRVTLPRSGQKRSFVISRGLTFERRLHPPQLPLASLSSAARNASRNVQTRNGPVTYAPEHLLPGAASRSINLIARARYHPASSFRQLQLALVHKGAGSQKNPGPERWPASYLRHLSAPWDRYTTSCFRPRSLSDDSIFQVTGTVDHCRVLTHSTRHTTLPTRRVSQVCWLVV